MAEMVIKSSTEESQLSMVEMMSVEEMVPDYFISHVSSQSALAGSDWLIGFSSGERVPCSSWVASTNSVRTRCSAARSIRIILALLRTMRITSGRIARLGSGSVPSE
jgi:hypothetical protein